MTVPGLIHQKSYEHVVYVLRRHPVTFIPRILLFLILFAAPFILYPVFQATVPNLLTGSISFPIVTLFASAYLLTILLFFYTIFTSFYLDVSIVTNDRIVDIEQQDLFSRVSSELDLFRIQDVTSEISGIFPTLFEYGTLTVLTASSNTHLIFHNIPNPNAIRDALIQLSHEDRKYHLTTDI